MNKPINKTVSIMSLVVKFDLNIRENTAAGYDLPALRQQVLDAGRIIKPIIAMEKEGELIVLQGNRRTLVGQELYQWAECPADLKESLAKMHVIVYKELSPAEELTLIFDHGSEKPISRSEVVQSVWRLDKQFFSESQIINVMYYALAKYTKNEAKIKTLSVDPKLREKELAKWLHGTVGNYMLSAAKMGQFVRDQFLLTAKAEDGTLAKDEQVKVKMSRDRVTALSAAKNSEKDQWTPDKGSPAFNELLAKFAEEDATGTKEKLTRPDVKELRDKADAFFSPLIRKAFLLAAGEKGEKVAGLDKDDDEFKRLAENFRIARENLTVIREVDPLVANLIGALVNGTASEMKNHLETFVGSAK